ncbi:MAG: TIGR02147 family protein [bacterium]|nr:TIGR02147 family protein [bacterium]MBU1918513.1 TIGR02147 family protein [bacterium]
MGRQKSNISVFEYSDYRTYLKNWYEEAKKGNGGFSYRQFSKKAGFSTSNFLMLVIKGQRNLTEQSLAKVMIGLGLNKQEQDFFRNLVFFNQAKTHEEQNLYYQQLLQSKKFNELKPIEKKQYEYYSTWYHPVVRELVCSPDFDGTAQWLSHKIYPHVSEGLCAKSIELLEELGFIKQKSDGKWQQTSSIVSTGPELTSLVVHNYHKSILELSKAVMDKLSTEHRDVSTLTLGIKRDRIEELKTKLRDFRKEILTMVSADTEPEEVVQLNMQFYPVTKSCSVDR